MSDGRYRARESRRGFLTTAAGAIGLAVAESAGSPAPAGEAEAATGQTVRDRLWIFTCVAGADNEDWGLPRPSRMTPAEGALYLGVPNLLLIRWQGKPAIPFDPYAISFRPMKRVVWSLVGSGGKTEEEARKHALELPARFGNRGPMPLERMKKQCQLGLRWLHQGRIEGIIFLANTVCDLELESVEWTRRWIAHVADQPLAPQAAIDAPATKPVD